MVRRLRRAAPQPCRQSQSRRCWGGRNQRWSSARAHVECLVQVNGIRSFRLYGREAGRVERLAQFVRTLGGTCAVGSDLERDLASADLVVTATSSEQPVLPRTRSSARLFVAVGSNRPTAAELPADVVRAARSIVVDSCVAARNESGDLILAGVDWDRVEELSSILDGAPGSFEGPIVFKSVGDSIWDLAAAKLARRLLSTSA